MRSGKFNLSSRVLVELERGFVIFPMVGVFLCGVVFTRRFREWVLFDESMEAGYLSPDIRW